ncbi:MAG: Sjogren's syndrome/scleroderma autoantigen 1 family protein [Candidatus Odinarchaeia archaeon]
MGDEMVAKMADYLRKGATMLSYNCPVCNSPLFKVKGEIYCINCNKKVKIVKEGEEEKEQMNQQIDANLTNLEAEILKKIHSLTLKLQTEDDFYKLEQIGKQLTLWLDIIAKIKIITKNS